jgi:hypothetical protein
MILTFVICWENDSFFNVTFGLRHPRRLVQPAIRTMWYSIQQCYVLNASSKSCSSRFDKSRWHSRFATDLVSYMR